MLVTLLKGKLHRATVTHANLAYEGSVAIDKALMQKANILPHEQVDIYNITNGSRITTYAIEAPEGSRTIGIQGAAAHHASTGDHVIICAYAQMHQEEAENWQPHVVILQEENEIKHHG